MASDLGGPDLTSLEGRLSSIETHHIELQRDVASLAKDVSALTQATHSMASTVQALGKSQTEGLRTNWSVVFAGISVAVLVAGLVVYQPLNSLTTYYREHVIDGHPNNVLVKLSEFEVRIDAEMTRRLGQLTAIEARLDEMAIRQERVSERVLGMERDVYSGASYWAGRPITADPKTQDTDR